ncbi:MAG: hypothetical protein VX346_13075 [Planctomycetota bacterium]|nr:hypothetical protein [Planctomycetota bacterium]
MISFRELHTMFRLGILLGILTICLFGETPSHSQDAVLALGSRRELFVDGHLIESQVGAVELKLHEPRPQEVALTFDQPWEGNTSGYPTVMYDGSLYRMIYRGHRMAWDSGKLEMANSPVACYAESKDGINWYRPVLDIVKWEGKDRSKLETPTSNNIIWGGSSYTGTFVPFEDGNPNCKPNERFKAVGGDHKVGLHLFTSPDAKHWTKYDEPIFNQGTLDSMNTLFWDTTRERYTLYFRAARDGLRSVDVSHSKDLKNWSPPKTLRYGDSPPQQMYTNGIEPYYRAPHLMVGFPTRYTARPITNKLASLPPVGLRKQIGDAFARIASDLSDGLFMTSRDGTNFNRWDEAFIRPRAENEKRPGNWMYGDNYQSYGLFPTVNEDGIEQLSFLVNHSYWQEYKTHLRRYTIRPDGFVSLNAKYLGGEVTTKLLMFTGTRLEINYATSGAGSLRIELQDNAGNPMPGFSLADCEELIGNRLDQTVNWNGGGLRTLAGKPLRLRFVLKDADLYSFKFSE